MKNMSIFIKYQNTNWHEKKHEYNMIQKKYEYNTNTRITKEETSPMK